MTGYLRLAGATLVAMMMLAATSVGFAHNNEEDGHGHIKGTVTAVGTDSVTIEGKAWRHDGGTSATLTLVVDAETEIFRNGDPATLADLEVGDRAGAKFHADGDNLVADKIRARGVHGHIKGFITAVGTDSVTIEGRAWRHHDGTTATLTLLVDAETEIKRNGEDAELADLEAGDKVRARFHTDGDTLVADKIFARSVHGHIVGVITEVGSDSVTIEGKAWRHYGGTSVELTLMVTAETEIIRNGQPAALADLQVGDKAGARFHPEGDTQVAEKIRAKAPHGHIVGHVTAVGTDSVTIEGKAFRHGGTPATLTLMVTAETVIVRNGEPATLADLLVGDRAAAKFHSEGDTLVADKIRARAVHGYIFGHITEVGTDSVTIEGKAFRHGGTSATLTLVVTADTVIVRNGEPATLADLKAGDKAGARFHVDGDSLVADKIRARATFGHIFGHVTEVGTDSVTIEGKAWRFRTGTSATLTLLITADTKITRNGEEATLTDLLAGDKAAAKFHTDGDTLVADSIDAKAVHGHIYGKITAVGTDSVTIEGKAYRHDGGKSATLTLVVDADTKIERNGEPATLADLEVGDKAGAKFHQEGDKLVVDEISARGE